MTVERDFTDTGFKMHLVERMWGIKGVIKNDTKAFQLD